MFPVRFVPLLATIAVFIGIADADPVEWSGNGHFYEAVSHPSGLSWAEASSAAAAAGGYLATITSMAENSFVFSLIDVPLYWNQEPGGSSLGPWLGGYQWADDGGDPSAYWAWLGGEPWAYTNWDNDEPNNYTGAEENYLSFVCKGANDCRSDQWNDLPDVISQFNTQVISFVIEYDGSTAVGEAASPAVLLGNAPNPFNPSTTIRFELSVAAAVDLAIYDTAGRVVRELARGLYRPAGRQGLVWDGRDGAGRSVPAGVYVFRLRAGRDTVLGRVALVK